MERIVNRMSKKAKREEHTISIDRPSICALEDVNKKSEIFYNEVIQYLNSNKHDFNKIDRILNIIKSSNLLIDDYGNGTSTKNKYLKIISKIIQGDFQPRLKNKASIILKDLENLKNIKKEITKSKVLDYGDNFNQVLSAYNSYLESKHLQSINEKMEINCQSFSRRLASNLKRVKSIKDLEKLNSTNFDRNLDMFYNIIEVWKYGNARIIRENERYIIDSVNDICATYIVNRNENLDLRQKNSKYCYSLNKSAPYSWGLYQLKGIAENLFYKLPALPNNKKENELYKKFGESTLYGIPIKEWLDILNIIQYNCEILTEVFLFLKKNKLFLKIDYMISGNIPSDFANLPVFWIKVINAYLKPIPNNYLKDIKKITEKLTYRRDIMDAPFILGKIMYLPTCYCIDPVYLVTRLMENTKKWSNKKGHWFEEYVVDFLRESGYGIEKKENTISDKSGKKEIDIILTDDTQAHAIIECKIFSNPHSIKYFLYENDRMRTSLYLEHASKNFEYFESKVKYNDSYRVFLSNIIFPIKNIEEWKSEINANFIYYLDIYKLSKGVSINELMESKNIINNLQFNSGISKINLQVLNKFRPAMIQRKNSNQFNEQIRHEYIKFTDNLIWKRLD